MSADNWAQCPRCQKALDGTVDTLARRLADDYGKITADEFASLQARHAEAVVKAENGSSTFREDYEIYGAEDGAVTVSYSGGCRVCGLSLSFRDDHPIPGLGS
jgi:hypothetical protein